MLPVAPLVCTIITQVETSPWKTRAETGPRARVTFDVTPGVNPMLVTQVFDDSTDDQLKAILVLLGILGLAEE